MASLLEKRMQICDISGYGFALTLEDAVELERRTALVRTGRSNLLALEASCESELTQALKVIEDSKIRVLKAAEDRFGEMKVAATTICCNAKRELSQLRLDLEQFLSSKEKQLSPAAELVCLNLSATPQFVTFFLADISDSISAAISDSWVVTATDVPTALKCLDLAEKHSTISSALAEAADQAQKGMLGRMQYADSLIGDEVTFDQIKVNVLSEFFQFEKKRIIQSWHWTQRSWELRQRLAFSEREIIEVGQLFASLLYRQFGRFSEAESILRQCLDVTQSQVPISEAFLSLCETECGFYFDTAQFGQADLFGAWVLGSFEVVNASAEHYWAILLYLIYSKRLQSKHEEAHSILEDWLKRDLGQGNKLADMLRLITCGIGAYFDGNLEAAYKWLFQARRIGFCRFPTSPFTALALSCLVLLSEGDAREQCLRQAQSIYEVASPKSFGAALNLTSLGLLHFQAKRCIEAEDCYRQAQSIYELISPKSFEAAFNLRKLGDLLDHMARQEQFEVSIPKVAKAVVSRISLGYLCAEREKWNEAEGCYRSAQSIYEDLAPKSVHAADNYWNMGLLFEAMKETEQAIECFQNAASIYAANGDSTSVSQAEVRVARLLKPGS